MYNLILPLQFTHFHIDDDRSQNCFWLVNQNTHFTLTFPDLQCSAANFAASRTHSTSIPSTYEAKTNGENQQCSKTLAFSCHESTVQQRTTPAFLDCLQYHTRAPNSWMDAHTCNCQDRLRLFPLVSVLTGQLQRTAETLCSFRPKPQQSSPETDHHQTRQQNVCLTLIPGMKSPLL